MYLGIDTHTRYSQVAVLEDDGNLQDEIRLPSDRLDELAEQYAGGEAAIETSGDYRPVYEMLRASRSYPRESIAEKDYRRCDGQDRWHRRHAARAHASVKYAR